MKLTQAYLLTTLVYPMLSSAVALPQQFTTSTVTGRGGFNPAVPGRSSSSSSSSSSHSVSFTTSTVTVRPSATPSSTSSSSTIRSSTIISSTSSSRPPVVISSTSSTPPVVISSTSSSTPPVVISSTSSTPPVVISSTSTPPVVVSSTSRPPVVVSSSSTPVVVSSTPGTGTTSSSLATSTSQTNDQAFVNSMLFYHNAYRAHHGTGPLVWNQTLADAALASASKCIFAHTTPYKYGENIAGGTYNNYAYYVFLWYDEVNQYNYNSPGFASSTGHFTQLIWKPTTQLGCAWVQGCQMTLRNLLFCEYYPNGNVNGPDNYRINVLPPQANPPNPAVPPGNLS